MKKLSFLMLVTFAFASVVLFNGCGDDPEPVTPENSPTLTLKPSSAQTLDPGASLTFTWDARKHPDGKNLKTLKVEKDGAGVVTATKKAYTSPATLKTADNAQYLDTLIVTLPLSGGPFVYKITIETEDGKMATSSVTVTLNATTPLATTKTGSFYHAQGATGCTGGYNLVGDAAVAGSGSDTDRDMLNTDAAGVAFTGMWMAKNTTMYVKDNAFDYANASVESAGSAYTAGTPTASVTPASGDIYIAKLRGGSDYAVVKITALDPASVSCNSATLNKGMISFEYKKK